MSPFGASAGTPVIAICRMSKVSVNILKMDDRSQVNFGIEISVVKINTNDNFTNDFEVSDINICMVNP